MMPSSVQLECADVWLLNAPGLTGVHHGVWALVCMVALEAMAFGRKVLWAMFLEEKGMADASQTSITDFFPKVSEAMPPITIVQRASRKSAAMFWCLLQDFVYVHQQVPQEWLPQVDSTHPFLKAVTTGGEGGKKQLRLNMPPGFNLPAHI